MKRLIVLFSMVLLIGMIQTIKAQERTIDDTEIVDDSDSFHKQLKTKFIDGTEIDSPCAIGVDPITGSVFISSRKKYPNADGTESVSYKQDGYVVRYNCDGEYVGTYECGVNPGTLLFVNHTKQVPVFE